MEQKEKKRGEEPIENHPSWLGLTKLSLHTWHWIPTNSMI